MDPEDKSLTNEHTTPEVIPEAPAESTETPTVAPSDAIKVKDSPAVEPISIEEVLMPPESPPDAPLSDNTSTLSLPTVRMPTLPQLAVALGGLALIFGLSYLPVWKQRNNDLQTQEKTPEREDIKEADNTSFFEGVEITATAAYVWDVKNQRAFYNKNAGKQLPLASLTKLMTVLVAYEHLDPEDRIAITKQAVLEEGNSNLASGEVFTLRDLVNFTLITSSNDGAYALAATAGAALAADDDPAAAFIGAMNAKAEEIGLSQSYFTNPTGLDINGATSGGYGSARDIAFLMEYLVSRHPDLLEGTKEAVSVIRSLEGTSFRAVNTNDVATRIPGLIGSKTGFTGLAGGNLVVAYDAGLNRPIVIAVLGSTRESRFNDMMTLIEKTAQTITEQIP